MLIIASSLISIDGTFGTPKIAYSQLAPNQTNSNTTNSANIKNIPLKKVHVGDIDIAYKMFGKGEPILLFNGASDGMDAWDPSFLKGLSGLMDTLKIQKANVFGYSLGGETAQQFTVSFPEKVNRLIFVSTTWGGKDSLPKPPEFKKLQSEIVNKSLNNVPISQEEMKSLVSASLGSGWVRLHPESVDIPTNITLQQMKPSLSPDAIKNQTNVGFAWEATNWNGACYELAKLAKPTLVITGTDDINYMPHANALVTAGKIPGAWLVQIKDAGHAVMDQYPDEIGKILNTFLSTTTTRR